jgi:MFS transporter, Spinster family, sphingosine-1-phosphate transporter
VTADWEFYGAGKRFDDAHLRRPREHRSVMRPNKYKHYLLTVLTIIVVFNYIDRLAIGIVLEDIKTELRLTDTQLGLLTGIAFALFYSVMGVPIARWADRGNRVTIISVTAALWSVMVALCGAVSSFTQLLLVRIGVAVGEAGCIPPAFSLMADYFSRAERPRAAAIYGLGGPIAALIGLFLAGWLNEFYGWRLTFVILGLPGLALATLAWFTLREPRKEKCANGGIVSQVPSEPRLKDVIATLWSRVTFRHMLLALAVNFFFGYGIVQWQPTFLIRSFGLATGEIGTWLGIAAGVGSLAGSYLGGELASRYAANDERLQMRAMAVALMISAMLSFFAYVSPYPWLTFVLIGLSFLTLSTLNGPLFAAIQTMVPERMRAVAFAFVYLVANLVGMGLGPLATGSLSDVLRPWAGEESLRYALVILSPGFFWTAWHLWRASGTVSYDMARAQAV